MSLAIPGHNRLIKVVFTAAALAAVVFGALALARSESPTASAQSAEMCEPERYTICISKETIGGDGNFLFEVRQYDPEDMVVCLKNVEVEDVYTVFLSEGESFAPRFSCGLEITETPQSGWQLVDIDCDFNNEVWDVVSIRNGIRVVLNPANIDGADVSSLDCVFVNRRIEERPLNLGGLFAGQPTPLPTAPAPAAVAPASTAPITPPRTGDAGLR